jgi:hypothetical protein
LNLSGIIDHGALNFKDKIALVYGENRYTYGRLKSAMDRIAFYLIDMCLFHGVQIIQLVCYVVWPLQRSISLARIVPA